MPATWSGSQNLHIRKNWLFSRHPNGAGAAATLYSLIETAKSCGPEPYQYLRYIFEKIPYVQSENDFAALLPRRLTPEQLSIIQGVLAQALTQK